MEEKKTNLSLVIPMAILALGRIIISVMLGIWFPAAQTWDDALMIQYANIKDHFTTPSYIALVKDMSFPFLLKGFSYLGLPYPVLPAVLWVLAALTVFFLVKRIFNGKSVASFIAYVYVLFMPQAFDYWSGTRFYRTNVLAPFIIITLSLIIFMIMDASKSGCQKVLRLLLLGLVFSFTYHLKEDGMWLEACLIFGFLVSVFHFIFSMENRKKIGLILKGVITLCIPFFVFVTVSLGYRALNYKYFGVFEINTRIDSEYGKFVEKVYKVESDNRSLYVWAPCDAIEKVMEASPTLKEYPQILKGVKNTPWYDNDIVKNPIQGDLYAWILRYTIQTEGLYSSEADIKELFRKANIEVEEAFKSGKLKKQEGVFQLLPTTGGYTSSEIKTLFPMIKESFLGAVTLKGYFAGIGVVSLEEILDNLELIDEAEKLSHVDYLSDYTKQLPKTEKCRKLCNLLLPLYKVVNIILCLLSCGIILFEIVKFFINIKSLKTFFKKRYKMFLSAITSLVFLGIGCLYAFSISWFCAFLFKEGIENVILNFYNIALPALLGFSYLFSLRALAGEIKLMKGEKKR